MSQFDGLKLIIGKLYTPCECGACSGHKLAIGDEWQSIFDRLTKKIFRNKQMPDKPDSQLLKKVFETLNKAVDESFGNSDDIDYDTPDYAMIDSLRRDIWHFSAAKNFHQLEALTRALVDDNGKVRTYREFKEIAMGINNQHINQWLETEYHTAIASSQMAAKWLQIVKDKESLPMLQFDAVMDSRTSELCRGFNGITLPIDHPFWNMYYPPNHFLCRSTVRQMPKMKATDISKVAIPEGLPAMFKVNLGKRGLAFPPDHPYYIGLPDNWTPKYPD